MTSYFDCSDAEGLRLGDEDDVECIHGIDLLEPCAKCKPMAANGGEENDMDPDKLMERQNPFSMTQAEFVSKQTTLELVALRNAVEIELKRRHDSLQSELKAVQHAVSGTKPRARRSDAGKPRAAKE